MRGINEALDMGFSQVKVLQVMGLERKLPR